MIKKSQSQPPKTLQERLEALGVVPGKQVDLAAVETARRQAQPSDPHDTVYITKLSHTTDGG